MKKRWTDADDAPEPKQKHGSYPPDIAKRRRELGLPVTPEEHAAYLRDLLRPRPRVPGEEG